MKDDFHIPSSAIERLRRFRRADTPPPFRLTQRDGEVLRLVARCRYLRTEHIFRRLFPQGALSNCRRRLRLLYHHGFLARIPGPELGSLTYTVDRRGLRLLRAEGDLDVRLKRSLSTVSTQPICHILAVNTFRVALELAAERLGAGLQWVAEDELRGQAPFSGSPLGHVRSRYAVPDAYIVLTFPARRMRFFLEVDMGSEDSAVIRRKVYSYLSLYATGAFQRAFAPEIDPPQVSLRVLFVAASGPDHARRLCSWIRRAVQHAPHTIQGLFWVADLEAASHPSRLLEGRIWMVVGQDGLSRLVG